MVVVKVFFTILIIALCIWLVGDTIRLVIKKVKERKKKKDSEKHTEVIEQKDNESN